MPQRTLKVTHVKGHGRYSHKVTYSTLRELKKLLKPTVETYGPIVKMEADPSRFDDLITEINGVDSFDYTGRQVLSQERASNSRW